MPRHSVGTGNVRPAAPLDQEEVKFWLQIMEEHALFIRTGLPADKTDLIEEAASFEREFKALRVRADKVTGEKKFAELITDTIGSLKEFLRYKRLLLGLALTNKLGSALPPLFFDHLIREAEYFMVILERICANKKLAVVKALEADFWLRLMADHTKFIAARIDPTECSLLNVVHDYEDEFDDLSMQARNYVSYLTHSPMELPAFDRFLQDSRVATVRLRDFKQAAYDMIIANRMLSTIPAIMADHVRREADHFLLMLSMMEKGVVKVEKDVTAFTHKYFPTFDEAMAKELCDRPPTAAESMTSGRDPGPKSKVKIEAAIDDMELDYTPGSDREKPPSDEVVAAKWEASDAEQPAAPGDKEKQEADVVVAAKVIATEKMEIPAKPPADPKTKQGKYKWGGNWPRQLGKIIK
jgi:hypothetical protein